MSKWPMRGHFQYLRFKTFPMTPRTPQCKVYWALLLNSKHSGVPEDSKSPTLGVLGFTPTLCQSRVATLLPTCVRDALPTRLRRPHQPLGPSSRWEDLLAFARLSIIAAPSDPRRSHKIHIRLFLFLPHPLPSCWFGRSLNSRRRRRTPHLINKRGE
jgi:hypothetical protein